MGTSIALADAMHLRTAIALLASVVGGIPVTFIWSGIWHRYLKKSYPGHFDVSDRNKSIAIWIGILERGFLTALVIWVVATAGPVAAAWIAVKAAGGWGAHTSGTTHGRSRFYVALMGSMLSISWAFIWGIWASHP